MKSGLRAYRGGLAKLAGLLLVAVAVAFAVIPDAKAASTATACETLTHKASQITFATGSAKAEQSGNNIKLSTPAQSDKAGIKIDLPVGVPLSDFTDVRYRVQQMTGAPDARTVAGLKLSLDNGKSAVLEPLYDQGPNAVEVSKEWQEWSGTAEPRRWWVTGAADTYLTWPGLLAEYPEANVTAVRVEQGSYNHGTVSKVAWVQWTIKGIGCTKATWPRATATPTATPTASPTPSVTPTATTSPTGTPTGTPSQTAGTPTGSPTGVAGTEDPGTGGGVDPTPEGLALTGEGGRLTPKIAWGGVITFGLGAALLVGLWVYRRRTQDA